jgi:hypothetical protein
VSNATLVGREQKQLHERLAVLEERAALHEAAEPDAPEDPGPDTDALSKEELERHAEARSARHKLWSQAHSNEARDATWAREEESAFATALQHTAARGRYQVVQVDCRTTLCTAELEWPSYALAAKGYAHALHVNVPGCESAILLEPPPDPSRPYRVTARYDCEEARTGSPK